MDIPNKVWEKNGGNAFTEFLNSCSVIELKDMGLLNQYIVGVILSKFFREGFKLGRNIRLYS